MCTATAKTRNKYASMITSKIETTETEKIETTQTERLLILYATGAGVKRCYLYRKNYLRLAITVQLDGHSLLGARSPTAQSAAIQDVTSRPNRGRKLGG